MENLDEYNVLINELASQFESSLPETNEILIHSFKNYLIVEVQKMNRAILFKKNKETIRDNIQQIAQSLITASIDTKKEILEDRTLEELSELSNYVFGIARETFLREEFIVNGKEFDFQGIMSRAKELRKGVKAHNIGEADFLLTEIDWDLGMIDNPLTNVMSHRMGIVYDSRGEEFAAARKELYDTMRLINARGDWQNLSQEEACRRCFDLYHQIQARRAAEKNQQMQMANNQYMGQNYYEGEER